MNARLNHTSASPGQLPVPRRRPAAPEAQSAPSKVYWNIPGFGPMTRLSTSFGEVPAQALRERDMLRTHNGSFVPVTQVRRYTLDDSVLAHNKDTLPILVRAGALGGGLPKQDVIVSPEQELALGSPNGGARFVKARELLSRPGVTRKTELIFTYTHIRCAQPALVRSEGVWMKIGSK